MRVYFGLTLPIIVRIEDVTNFLVLSVFLLSGFSLFPSLLGFELVPLLSIILLVDVFLNCHEDIKLEGTAVFIILGQEVVGWQLWYRRLLVGLEQVSFALRVWLRSCVLTLAWHSKI